MHACILVLHVLTVFWILNRIVLKDVGVSEKTIANVEIELRNKSIYYDRIGRSMNESLNFRDHE